MTWTALIPLIAQYGLPWAYNFWKIVSGTDTPTDAQWQALLAMSQKPLSDYIKEAADKAGIPTPIPGPVPQPPG